MDYDREHHQARATIVQEYSHRQDIQVDEHVKRCLGSGLGLGLQLPSKVYSVSTVRATSRTDGCGSYT